MPTPQRLCRQYNTNYFERNPFALPRRNQVHTFSIQTQVYPLLLSEIVAKPSQLM